MGFFSRFERRMENGLEGAADKMFDAPISPVQISKKAEKAMRQEKMVGAGKQYAPTLYTVLVNPEDDQRLFGYYPTLAGETETYLAAKAQEEGLLMDGQPLVRFIVDDDLKHGKFDIIAEMVSAPIVKQLRDEENARYGIGKNRPVDRAQNFQQNNYRNPPRGTHNPLNQQEAVRNQAAAARQNPARFPQNVADPYAQQQGAWEPADSYDQDGYNQDLPYVPENEIDRSIDYGEYTFNSEDFVQGNQGQQPIYQSPASNGRHGGVPAEARTQVVGQAPAEARTQIIGQAGPMPQPCRLTNMSTNRIENLMPKTYILGRGAGCDVAVNDINASREHAQLKAQADGTWTLTDLDSTNGTKVNGKRINSTRLQEGDRITIGMTNYLFSMQAQ